jgi:hypothetical protein
MSKMGWQPFLIHRQQRSSPQHASPGLDPSAGQFSLPEWAFDNCIAWMRCSLPAPAARKKRQKKYGEVKTGRRCQLVWP